MTFFFFEGKSSSAHALSFINPTTATTALKTFFTILRNVLYSSEALSRAFLLDSIERGISIALTNRTWGVKADNASLWPKSKCHKGSRNHHHPAFVFSCSFHTNFLVV